ncbi:MAG: tetratricopeptide repeat protein [Symploca sp. SIO1C2]|nr:tetratricopeptide repeat protein [Symploca sp. SIO1C2]
MPRAVILTALPVEYKAVQNHLEELEEKVHSQGTIYEQGKFIANQQEWEVIIAEVGAGNTGAAAATERAIAYFQPNILLFVGIAGGIKDVAIGDVVVATDVYGYESGKVGEQFWTRPKAGKSAYRLLERAKFEARKGEWLKRLDSTPVKKPRVFLGTIVAGEKVVASRESAIFQLLRGSYNQAIAVEMEGFGFLSAAFAYDNAQAVVIRGISDLIEGKNDNSVEPEEIRQAKAAQHASAFAFEILAKLEIKSSSVEDVQFGGNKAEGNNSRLSELDTTSPLKSIVPRVTKSVGWLPLVASCVITAVGEFKLIRGELEPLTVSLLAVGFVGLLFICLYVFFKQSKTDGSEDRVSLVKRYSQKTRRLAFVGWFIIVFLLFVTAGDWYYQQNLWKNQVVVLVANFKNLQPEKRGVEEEIIRQLGDALTKYDDVKVQALKEEITAQEGSKVARAKGKKHHADIVLWGWYEESKSNVKVTVKFEVLEKLRYLSSVQTKPLIQPIAKLESFEIQAQLSQEMSYLTLFTIGLVRYEAEDYDGAIARFTKALEFVPDTGQGIVKDTAIDALYLYRGVAYYLQGVKYTTYYKKALDEQILIISTDENAYSNTRKLDKAIADFNQALNINPEDAAAYHSRGTAYFTKGELDQAIADFTQALKINPEYDDAYNNRGLAYSKQGEADKAIADFTQALKINLEDADTYINLGIAYSRKGELDQAIADFNRALKINPESASAYYNLGIVYSKKGELDQVIADCTQALNINHKYAAAYATRGSAYVRKGELDQAITDFNRALKINPEDAAVYTIRGSAYSDKGEVDKAIADFTQAIDINPELAEVVYKNRGIVYSDKGEVDKAIADYTQAIGINSEDTETYKYRGIAYGKKGEFDQAIADFNRVLKINPEDAEVYYNRGSAYHLKGETDKAIADYTQALNINSEYVEIYNNRGVAYYNNRELDQAIADYTQALKINPESAAAYYNRGNAYYDKGELNQAIADYTQALKINPEFAEAYIIRGIAYLNLGDQQKTIQDFKKAAKLYTERGNTAGLQQILELLKIL